MDDPLRQFLLILLFIIAAQVQAQDTGSIEPGQTVEGQLSAGDEARWTFVGRDGAMLSLYAEAQSGGLDPVLTILSQDGSVLLRNDDLAYPDNTNALIEGFTIPRTGTYTALVSGYGASSGRYSLTLLPGYGELETEVDFAGVGAWRRVAGSEEVVVSGPDGRLRLDLSGIRQMASVAASIETPDDFYVSADVNIVLERNGWQAGMMLRQQGDSYLMLAINHRGLWRLDAYDGDDVQTLRDWTSHPAIVAGETAFELGVLAYGGDISVFYNGQLVGTAIADLLDGGRIGLVVGTADALGSEAGIAYDNLLVTVPFLLDGEAVLTDQVVTGPSNLMVRELQRRGWIPGGGELGLTLPQSFVQYARPGVSRINIGGGAEYGDLAMGTTVVREASGSGTSGCGVVLRDDGNATYTVAYTDSTGGYGLSNRVGDSFTENFYGTEISFNPNNYHLLVVARDDLIHLFVDGQYAGQISSTLSEGQVGEVVLNFDALDTSCRYNDLWVWRWR